MSTADRRAATLKARKEAIRSARIFEAWLTNHRYAYPKLASFRQACDRGEVEGLGPGVDSGQDTTSHSGG